MNNELTNLSFYSVEDYGGFDTSSDLFLTAGMKEVRNPNDADIIIFNGGADIGTEVYGEAPVFRGVPAFMSRRDTMEIELYKKFVGTKFLFGICRGAQLLNCLNGGKLWQHVDNHTKSHSMLDLRNGAHISITSTHHQMMKPHESGEVIAVASESKNKFSEYETLNNIRDLHQDIEVVWYPKTRTLCVQGHPEYVPGSKFANWCFDLIVEKFKAAA